MNVDILPIHTHDRIRYKRCRRKWHLGSPLRLHLVPKEQGPNIHLWLGSGFHFALEDFHGYNRFGDPCEALAAFYSAFHTEELPEGAEDSISLGIGMFEHYKRWLKYRELYQTVWLDSKPQVEVHIELQFEDLSEMAGAPVIFRGTIDRVVEDEYGNWWVQDYKTAANIDTNKLATDPQIGNYVWAAEQHYEREIAGMIYTQFAKKVPKPPKVLKNGWLSVDQRQQTTYAMYREALLERCPDGKYPSQYIEFLNELASRETPEGDVFIRSDQVERNHQAKLSTYQHMWHEINEMLNPDLPIYPNPTRDCMWDCSEFRAVCLAMDEGDDYEYLINEFYQKKGEDNDSWKHRIKWPT